MIVIRYYDDASRRGRYVELVPPMYLFGARALHMTTWCGPLCSIVCSTFICATLKHDFGILHKYHTSQSRQTDRPTDKREKIVGKLHHKTSYYFAHHRRRLCRCFASESEVVRTRSTPFASLDSMPSLVLILISSNLGKMHI